MPPLNRLEELDALIATADLAAMGELLERRRRLLQEAVRVADVSSLASLQAVRERGMQLMRRLLVERALLAAQHARMEQERRVLVAFQPQELAKSLVQIRG